MQPLHYRHDVLEGQFVSGVKQVWIWSLLSLRLVALPRLEGLVYPTILPIVRRTDVFADFLKAWSEIQTASSRFWTWVTKYDAWHL